MTECAACRAERPIGTRPSTPVAPSSSRLERAASAFAAHPRAARAPQAFAGGGTVAEGSSGQPLDESVRTPYETRLGTDFSRVRVHADGRAARSAHTLGARAYAVGGDIVFGAGEYLPETESGRRLLAHELTHVAQQARGETGGRVVQRTLKVLDPGRPPPSSAQSRGTLVADWMTTLCPAGTWTVDSASGVVGVSNRADVCGPRARPPNPTSCRCLCTATARRTPDIDVAVADVFPTNQFRRDARGRVTGRDPDPGILSAGGEGFTRFRRRYDVPRDTVVVSGRSHAGLKGVGDTSAPRPGELRDPPWIIFGHELCGHLLNERRLAGRDHFQHSPTQYGDRSAVDIENRIRREHSTTASSWGIRTGGDAVVIVAPGENYTRFSARLGLPTDDASAFDRGVHRWISVGDPIDLASKRLVVPGAVVYVADASWHETISGESWESIARIWNRAPTALRRANPRIRTLTPGLRLLVPPPTAANLPQAPSPRQTGLPAGTVDPIHAPMIEEWRRRHGLQGDEGPSDAEIKYRLGVGS
jgi:hypothetical protein